MLKDDTLLLESDLIFDERLITDLLADPEPTLAVVDMYQAWMDGTVVQISSEKTITQFIPKKFFNYNEKHTYYKTVNVYKFSKEFLQHSYVPFLEAYSQAMGNNEYYEQVLRVITTLEKNELKAFCLTGQKWYEIDDIQDKDIAENLFSNTSSEKMERLQKRYGGYWRFPFMLDYCYLVNPYFPTEQMKNEIKSFFGNLLTEYPSGLSVQNLLAGKLFDVEETDIIVGNGGAELIHALSHVLSGSVGVIYPTFNEYPESLVNNTIISFFSENLTYSITDLMRWSKECDNLLLINPDNPSGNFISGNDIFLLLDDMIAENKTMVLDESFIDFSAGGPGATLISQDVIDKYPNLIIIKSISKSYGVPGIRLGVLACGNPNVIKSIRKNISIWNINSFGEFFLQIIGKYRKDYLLACTQIIAERERFRTKLEQVSYLEVFPSQANYFLCKCGNNITAGKLAEYLLGEHDIYIKDLTGKKGIEGDIWIRLAVRDSKDNDFLVEKLLAFGEANV